MKFVLVNGRRPRPEAWCALCCEPIGESYLRELTTRLSYCSHECYLGHCKLAVPARTERGRASCDDLGWEWCCEDRDAVASSLRSLRWVVWDGDAPLVGQ